jgi:hypothetical protein
LAGCATNIGRSHSPNAILRRPPRVDRVDDPVPSTRNPADASNARNADANTNRVRPEDIAAIKVQDKAQVTAYDSSKYGKVKGEVTDISPTTFEDDDKSRYYRCSSAAI